MMPGPIPRPTIVDPRHVLTHPQLLRSAACTHAVVLVMTDTNHRDAPAAMIPAMVAVCPTCDRYRPEDDR